MTQKPCVECQRLFPPRRATQKFCSLDCSHAHRQRDPVWKAAQRRGGLAHAKAMRALMRQRWSASGVPPEQARQLYGDGYRVGWKRGHRVGYSDGYERALKDMKRARVA